MYEKYLEQLEEAGKIRNLKERSINCYKNYVSYFLKYQGKNPEFPIVKDTTPNITNSRLNNIP